MGTWRFHNVTTNADFWPVLNSISVSNQQPCQLATFTGRIVGNDDLTEEDEVEVLYAADDVTFVKFFAGNISVLTLAHIEPIAEPAVYEFSARDFTATLDDSGQGTLGNRNVTENADDRVAWIMGLGNDFGITLSGVTETTPVGPFDYTSMSHREALAQVAGVVGAVFYVDFDKDLQFYDAESVIAAPFDLATPASPTSSYPYRAFRLDHDSTDRADEVVAYGQDNIFAVFTRPGAPAANLRKRRAITTDLTSLTDLTTAASIESDRIGTPQLAGSLVMWQPGLSSGQTVHIVNPTHSIDDDFIISQVSYSYTDTNPTDVGEPGGSVVISVSFSDRLLCIPRKDVSRSLTPATDCTDCTRRVALLPSGMDENLSLAQRIGGMFAFDGMTLAWYDCSLNQAAVATPASHDLDYIDHEPVGEAVLNGDAALYTGTVGPFGDDRWTINEQVTAAKVMDIRKAWIATQPTMSGFNDQFNRSTTSPALGTADSGETWASAIGGSDSSGSISGVGSTINCDGDEMHWHGNGSGHEFEKNIRSSGPWDGGVDGFMQAKFRIVYSGAPSATQLLVFGAGLNNEPLAVYLNHQTNDSWKFGLTFVGVGGGGDFTETTISAGTIVSGTDYLITWSKQPNILQASAALYEYGGGLVASLDAGTTGTAAEEAALTAASSGINGFSIYGKGLYDIYVDYVVWNATGGGLQRRDMVDGSLEAAAFLRNATFDIRVTPNRQHLMVILWDNDNGPFQRFSRTPDTEGGEFSITGWSTDLADWCVDDVYTVYKLTTTGVLTRYDVDGTFLWDRDLNADYGYQWPTRVSFGAAYANGQTILVNEGVLYVCGYLGGADWQSGGSQAVVLKLDPEFGELKDTMLWQTTGGNAGAMALAMEFAGPCIWVGGCADGTDFEGETISGVSGWIGKRSG